MSDPRAFFLYSLLCAAFALAGSAAASPPATGGPWALAFADEFNGTSVDQAKWTTCYWWDDMGCTNLGNKELEWYLPENVSTQNGQLHLTAREQDATGINDKKFSHTSGIVTTGRYYGEDPQSDRFSFRYGYVEVRARIPEGQGLWPAIWLLPSTLESTPEIDIMEVYGHAPDLLEFHFHYKSGSDTHSVGHDVATTDLSKGWHVYGLDWKPDAITWYLDGVELWRFTDKTRIPSELMYLLINLAIGGEGHLAPNATTILPAEFRVDYVHIWKHAADE